MDVIAAYREVGTYRGAAEICGTTHKTVRRVIERAGLWIGPSGASLDGAWSVIGWAFTRIGTE